MISKYLETEQEFGQSKKLFVQIYPVLQDIPLIHRSFSYDRYDRTLIVPRISIVPRITIVIPDSRVKILESIEFIAATDKI